MALTSAQVEEILSEAGVATENIKDAAKKIMSGHITSINALREERDSYKEAAEKLPGVQRELDALKQKGDPDWQKKFDDEHSAFEKFKQDVAAEKEATLKKGLYTQLLKNRNIAENHIESILNVTNFNDMILKDGKLDNEQDLITAIDSKYSGFILKKANEGTPIGNPPANEGNGDDDKPSRAKELAAKYREDIHGKAKES